MIAPQAHEPVEPEARKYLTQHQKIARWNELGRCCTICGEPCAPFGPTVVWDHRIPRELGGSNLPANFEPNHAEVCAPEKTRRDQAAIAKARRLRKKADPNTRKPPTMKSRGFQKRSHKRPWPKRAI
jgi:5-methylcytosine-specific restriction endonuclease McrA